MPIHDTYWWSWGITVPLTESKKRGSYHNTQSKFKSSSANPVDTKEYLSEDVKKLMVVYNSTPYSK